MHSAEWAFGTALCEEGLRLALWVSSTNELNSLSLRGAEWLRGAAEANPEIPRFARNKFRNPRKDEIATPFALNTMRCRASGSQ